nr:GyrI-like domain-containing protein [Clostridium yunnanense]
MIKPKFQITGIEHTISFTENNFVANEYAKQFLYTENKLTTNSLHNNIYIGYTNWKDALRGYTLYMPSMITDKSKNPPSGMVSLTIPSHKYVVFRFAGFFNLEEVNTTHLLPVLEYMFTKWIFKGGYEFADTFRFEYVNLNISNSSYCEIDLYQPIKRK